MVVISAARSDVGCTREANEDSFAAAPEHGLFAVADGLGGHVAGRRASDAGVAAFFEHLGMAPGEGRPEAMRRAIRCANDVIRAIAQGDPELKGMGTTLVAAWFAAGSVSIAHVGDSRLYLWRDGELRPLTLDHSLVADMVLRRQLSERDARDHPHRHVITRALGVLPEVEPDLSTWRVEPGDRVLMCTDGVHGQVPDAAIAEVLGRAGSDLDAAVEALIERANAAGGEDNATAVLVEYRG